MAMYSRQMSEDNSEAHTSLKRNLIQALQQDVTQRQREMLLMYYSQGQTMQAIALTLGVDRSTVSRTIKRGEQRLQRCLRYGAEALLRPREEDDF